MKKYIVPLIFVLFNTAFCFGQIITKDSKSIDYKKVYSLGLDANIQEALGLISNDTLNLSKKDKYFIIEFKNRFAYKEDKSSYLKNRNSEINGLLQLFHSYWREALLNPYKSYDDKFLQDLSKFLSKELYSKNENIIEKDSIDNCFNKYIKSKNLFATDGVGKTGKLYDLLVWQTQKDTIYKFKLGKEFTTSRVILMQGFITLGWEEYATIDRYYPGGWATKDALYCVEKAYDLNSEDFLISYLAHEGFHFKDYQNFPKLKSADLEYRAKLIELSLADKTLFELIDFFIINAKLDSENGHSVANYCVIRDLSRALFKNDFEKDITKWKTVGRNKVNNAAYSILKKNTSMLTPYSKIVEEYIKYKKVSPNR